MLDFFIIQLAREKKGTINSPGAFILQLLYSFLQGKTWLNGALHAGFGRKGPDL